MTSLRNLEERQELKNKLNEVTNWTVVSVNSSSAGHEFLIQRDDKSLLQVFARKARDKQGSLFKLEYVEISDLSGNVSANSTTMRGN